MTQRGQSSEKLQEKLRGQESWISKLNQEADGLKSRLQIVEESKLALQNNRQFKETQEKFEQQISNLESDKVSLMKRLNMVLSELEKATHEKSEVNAKLLEQERMAEELKRKLDEVSSLKNVVNRNLQEDLRYERELNDKLRDELTRFEREKEQLIGRLKEQEELGKDISRETSAINANLQRKTEDLRRLEREHEANLVRLRELSNQYDSIKGQELHSKTEKRRMEDELNDLQRERNELIRRMNELSDKYEDYVTTMNRERMEIMKANKNHVKLLTSKLIFQILSEMVQQRRKAGIEEINNCAKRIHQMESKLYTFARVIGNYGEDRKRHYLRLWYRNSMNFIHEHYKKLNLVEFNVSKKRKIKFFYKWRSAFLNKRKDFEGQVDGLKMLRNILIGKKDLSLRRYLCKWRDFVQLRQVQQDFLLSVMSRKKQRTQRNGFVRWLGFTKKQALEQRYETMSELITNMWFKQRVFLALRYAVLQSKTEDSVNKFKAWRDWCERSRKLKYFQRKKKLVDRLQGTRDEGLIKQVFDAIRFHNINRKYEETKEQLDKEIPVRMELEKKRDTMLKLNNSKDKYNMFRSLCIRVADVKYRAIQIWKESIKYDTDVKKKLKLRVIEIHKNRLSKAFFKWKEGADKKQVIQLVTIQEDLINENQELQNTLQSCQVQREKQQDQSGRQKSLKLERIRNMLNRNFERRRFYQWHANTVFLSQLESALFLTQKTIRRRKMRNGFNKFLKQVEEAKRLDYINTRVRWFDYVRDRARTDTCFDAWKKYVKQYVQAKKFLMRSIKGVDRSIKNEAVEQWKKMVFTQRKQVYVENIEELKRRQEAHEEQLKDLNKQIQINDSQSKHLQSKLQSQSHKIMANFIARQIHFSQAKGFYTWLDNLKEFKNKRRMFRSVVNYWTKNKLAIGFRQWADFMLRNKEQQLAQKLLQRESERRNLQRIKDEEEKMQTNDLDNLQQELAENKQLKDQLQNNYEKALETHISRIHNNTYINKTQHIFQTWADYVKQEKNAVHVIGAIARKNLRMEVFSRIRRVARENYLDDRANKILTKYCRLFKSRVVSRAFQKWRVNSYTQMVTQMNQKQYQLAQLKDNQSYELDNMQLQKQRKALRVIKQKRQREILGAWIQTIKTLKQLRIKQDIMAQNVKFMQQRWATQKWYMRTKRTLFLRRRDDHAIAKFQQRYLKQCLEAWKEALRIDKNLFKKSFKFVKRLQYLDLAHAFQQIMHYKKSYEARKGERKDQGSKSIYNVLRRLLKHKMSDALLSLKNRTHKRNFKESFMKKAFNHTITARLRHFFGKWKHNGERTRIAETINNEGEVVQERNAVSRKVKILKEFLKDQGYKPEEVEQYIKDKSEQQKSNMNKAVVGFFFKNSDFQIIPKAFNQWKRWLQIRKLCKHNSNYVVNALNHPLFWAFRKWKCSQVDGRSQLKDMTKKDLIDKIMTDELAIGSAQSRLSRMNDAIENLSIQRDSLLQHYISGQKLALALGKNNYLRTMFRSFLKWKRYTKSYEQERLEEQLERTNSMIKDLLQHVDKLEGINRNMLVENEELRQAALDGIEIAKAVQELTREREQLSVDLQDRGQTIKKLIEDNNNLSLRLSIAQKEAEQLEQLNQQSYLAPPEREKFY